MNIYHYTDEASYKEILASKRLLPSQPWTTDDSSYGPGWYFTELGPTYCDVCLAEACWNDASQVHRVRCYLAYEVDDGGVLVSRCRQFVLLITSTFGFLFRTQQVTVTSLPVMHGWTGPFIRFLGGGRRPVRRCQRHWHL